MFCIVKGMESLGMGKVIEQTGTKCMVEYFYSPDDVKRDVITVLISQIICRHLGGNTRVYHYNEISSDWTVGRVIEDYGDQLMVRFADRAESLCNYDEIFIRCKRPIDDSVAYLAKAITETPQYAEDRSSFLASYIRQRGAAWGISALLSSIIELEPHQISVVRRILNDPSQRYLLADEVGLGKTIEAGVIIRQAVLDAPKNHQIVVLVPKVLIHQWREELTLRFGLEDFLDNSVFVTAQDGTLDEIDKLLKSATMLVIDEAHHVTSETNPRFVQLYNCLCVHAPAIDRLLLLSATPVLRNEMGFLRMLHLLDPVMYSLDDKERFCEKIQHRQILAESVAMLDPQNALFLDGILDELQTNFPDDERLLELISKLRSLLVGVPDENDPVLIDSINQLRAHLSETYRLHRRILRNRRKRVDPLVIPNRAGGEVVTIGETQLAKIESLIEDWRIEASIEGAGQSTKDLANFYWELLSSLCTNPGRLPHLCNERLALLNKSNTTSFLSEETYLSKLVLIVDPDVWFSARFEQLEQLVSHYLPSSSKIVIFCSDSTIADKVYGQLIYHHPNSIVRHTMPNDDDFATNSSAQFVNQDTVRIIVCDRAAEEGLNLQGKSKLIIHFDLPMEPNRIEQRMGRVDRYGAGDPIKSFILLDEGSRYQQHWYTLISNALGVFNRSISSLQYLVEDKLQILIPSVFAEGIEALIALTDRLSGPKGDVAEELRRIDEQDALDELIPMAESNFDDISDADEDWKEIRRAVTCWSTNTLLFREVSEPLRFNSIPTDPPFRFCYILPGYGGAATLIPLSGFLEDFIGVLDFNCRRSSARNPLSYPHCARRQTAVRYNSRLLRYGDEFVEALKSFADMDDRGRSYALWRQIRNDYFETEPKFYFRFDFLVEADLSETETALAQYKIFTDTAHAAIKRRGDSLFPPFVDRIWIDENGVEPSDDFIEHFLDLPYDKLGINPRYIDKNLKSVRLRKLMVVEPDAFANWDLRCIRMRDSAKTNFLARVKLAEWKKVALDHAHTEDDLRQAQLRTRIQSLTGREGDAERVQLATEKAINEGLYRGIAAPTVKIDVSGVVLLSARPLPTLEN